MMPCHALAGHGAIEDLECGKQRGRAMPDIVVGHRPGPVFLRRQAWLRAVERVNLRLLINREHKGPGRRVEIQPDHIRAAWRQTPDPRTACSAAPGVAAAGAPPRSTAPSAARYQWSPPSPGPSSERPHPGGSPRVSAITRSTNAGDNPGFLAFSRNRPATPSRMNRSCQRHTYGFETPPRRMISAAPHPSAVAKIILARPDMLLRLLRSATIAANRPRSAAPTSMLILSRMAHHGTCCAHVCVVPLG